MPAQDLCHPAVVNALQKQGWRITGEQIYNSRPDLYVYIDIEASKEGEKAFIEVKYFPELNLTTGFYIAAGQYIVYRQVISTERPNYELYLTIPETIFNTLGETYNDTIRDNRVKILVVNLKSEQITKWITY